MKSFNLSRCALGVCVAVTLLGGCGQTNSTLTQSNGGMPSIARGPLRPELAQSPAGGGAFSGGYSGSSSRTQCESHGPTGQSGLFIFSGKGKVSFLGRSKESGNLYRLWIGEHYGCAPFWEGAVSLTSSKYPTNTISMHLVNESTNPCQPYSFTVTGGTGKFANANGSGTVTFTCGINTYADQWSGTLSF